MRILIALAAIAIPLASTPAHTPRPDKAKAQEAASGKSLGGKPDCRRPDLHPADSVGESRFNRLGELPPGHLVLTVFREVDGCPDPMIVGQPYGFGGLQGDRTQDQILPPARRR